MGASSYDTSTSSLHLASATFSRFKQILSLQSDGEAQLKGEGDILLIFAIGAFLPQCSELVSGYANNLGTFSHYGIHKVFCIAANDVCVMRAWRKALNISSKIHFLADEEGDLIRGFGLWHKPVGESVSSSRSRRASIVLSSDFTVKHILTDELAYVEKAMRTLEMVPLASHDSGSFKGDRDGRSAGSSRLYSEGSYGCDIESLIIGEPYEDDVPESLFEFRRSRNNQNSVDSTVPEISDTTDSAFCDDKLQTVQEFQIDLSACKKCILNELRCVASDAQFDVKIAYSLPGIVNVKRWAADGINNENHWFLSMTARNDEWGFLVMEEAKYQVKEIHLHAPCLHVEKSCHLWPIELHIVHSIVGKRLNDSQTVDDRSNVVVVCLRFTWDPEVGERSCAFLSSLIGTILSSTVASDNHDIDVSSSSYPYDLKQLIAENTIATFYRYETINFPVVKPLHDSNELPDIKTSWLVARNFIPLPWKTVAQLSALFNSSNPEPNPRTFLKLSLGCESFNDCDSRVDHSQHVRRSTTTSTLSSVSLEDALEPSLLLVVASLVEP